MRKFLLLSAVCGLAVWTRAWADEPEPEDTKAKVRELDTKDLGLRGFPRGRGPTMPTEINNAEELAKAIPDKEAQARVKKEVNFRREKLLFFAWAGSGGDRLTFDEKLAKGKKGPEAVFHFKRGLTRDLRAHHKLFAVPKKAGYRVAPAR